MTDHVRYGLLIDGKLQPGYRIGSLVDGYGVARDGAVARPGQIHSVTIDGREYVRCVVRNGRREIAVR